MIAIGSDHGGVELKEKVIKHLQHAALSVKIQAVTAQNPVIIRYMQRR